MKLTIFSSWLQKQWIGSADINLCSRSSCLTSHTMSSEGQVWDYLTVARYRTLVSGSLPRGDY